MNMEEGEKLISPQESIAQPEAQEGLSTAELNKVLEDMLHKHADGRIEAIKKESQGAISFNDSILRSADSSGYSHKQVEQLFNENNTGRKLAGEQEEIRQLEENATDRIEAITDPGKQEHSGERERTIENAQEQRQSLLTDVLTSDMVSNGLNVVPFVGGGKMIVESIVGKSLNGEVLTGKDRIIRAAMGAGSLALDFTGIGEAKDVAIIGGKSIGLISKAGTMLAGRGILNGAQIFKATAEFMASHPQLTAFAEKYAEGKIRDGIQQIKQYRQAA